MTKQGYTHILAIIDRSGSMAKIKTDTEGGFNSLVKEQATAPGECRFDIVQFDDVYEVVHTNVPAGAVPPFELVPRNTTALYDAIGRGSTELGARLAALPEDQRPDNVIVMVLSDGDENASVEFTSEMVAELIERQTKDYSWTFTFLGSNQDAVLTGAGLNIPMATSLTYEASGRGVGVAMASASSATLRSRSGGGYSYSKEERRAAAGGTETGGGQ
jgi:hypothetical protein